MPLNYVIFRNDIKPLQKNIQGSPKDLFLSVFMGLKWELAEILALYVKAELPPRELY